MAERGFALGERRLAAEVRPVMALLVQMLGARRANDQEVLPEAQGLTEAVDEVRQKRRTQMDVHLG